ncbi:MAG: MFS transporter [Myxococcales bacterium]
MIQPIYFFYFMSVGISMPFFSPYLLGLGFSGRQIAVILCVVPVLNMGVPLFWAWKADRTRRHARILSVICLGAFCGYLPLVVARAFPLVLVSYLAFAVFGVGIGTMVDSMALVQVRAGADYGRIRVWGSIGYMAAAIAVGALLTSRAGRPADPIVPALVATALLATFLATLQLRGIGEPAARPHWNDVNRLLANPRFRLLLVVAPLHWIGCAPYNIFFGIFVRDHHLSQLVVGAALATGVAAEMIVLLLFQRLRRRFDIDTLMAVAFGGTIIRWALMPFAAAMASVITLQLLHALTFGLFWGAGIALVGDCVPPALRATGQSLYVTSMLGLGNVLGYLATGLIYDAGGTVDPAFWGAAALELLPLALVLHARARRLTHGRGPVTDVRA